MKPNTYRIVSGVLVATTTSGVCIYNAVHSNNLDYQSHPVASLFGSMIPGIIAGFAIYWWMGWRTKQKEEQLNRPNNFHPAGRTIASNAGDGKFYDKVARELQEKPMIPGLWTKAFAEMEGDDAKARALYIKYRVANLKEEERNTHIQLQREEEERKKEEARNGPAMKLQLKTICKKRGYAGCMEPSSSHYRGGHGLFETACKCPKCLFKFDWYYVRANDFAKAQLQDLNTNPEGLI